MQDPFADLIPSQTQDPFADLIPAVAQGPDPFTASDPLNGAGNSQQVLEQFNQSASKDRALESALMGVTPQPDVLQDVATQVSQTPQRLVAAIGGAPQDIANLLAKPGQALDKSIIETLLKILPEGTVSEILAEGQRKADAFAAAPESQVGAGFKTIKGLIEKNTPLRIDQPETTPGLLAAIASDFAAPVAQAAALSRVGTVPATFNAARQAARSAPALEATAARNTNATIADFDAAGVPLSQPAVSGSVPQSVFANALENIPFVGSNITKLVKAQRTAVADKRDNLARTAGAVRDESAIGESSKEAVKSFERGETNLTPKQILLKPTRKSSVQAKEKVLYDRIPIEDSAPTRLSNTRSVLSAITSKFSTNQKLAAALSDPRLNRFLSALTEETKVIDTGILNQSGEKITRTLKEGGTLTWQELKDFRSIIGEMINERTLLESISPSQLRRLFGAITEDMKATALAQNGKKAVAAFERANNFTRLAKTRLDKSLKKFFKTDKNETTFSILKRAAQPGEKGDVKRFVSFMRSVPEDLRRDISATFIANLGKPTAAASADEVISVSRFVTDYNSISEAAKLQLFNGIKQKQLKASLDNLSRVAEALKNVDKLGNPSGSGRFFISGGIGSLLVAQPVITAATVGGALVTSKMMTSPAFVRWLAKSARLEKAAAEGKVVGGAFEKHVRELGVLAAANDNAAPDIARFFDAIKVQGTAANEQEQNTGQ